MAYYEIIVNNDECEIELEDVMKNINYLIRQNLNFIKIRIIYPEKCNYIKRLFSYLYELKNTVNLNYVVVTDVHNLNMFCECCSIDTPFIIEYSTIYEIHKTDRFLQEFNHDNLLLRYLLNISDSNTFFDFLKFSNINNVEISCHCDNIADIKEVEQDFIKIVDLCIKNKLDTRIGCLPIPYCKMSKTNIVKLLTCSKDTPLFYKRFFERYCFIGKRVKTCESEYLVDYSKILKNYQNTSYNVKCNDCILSEGLCTKKICLNRFYKGGNDEI